jgi:hypothetical protein
MSYAEPFHSCPPKGPGQTRTGVVVYNRISVNSASERNAVEDISRIAIQKPQYSILARAGDHVPSRPTDRRPEHWADVRDIVIVYVVRNELSVPARRPVAPSKAISEFVYRLGPGRPSS